MKLNSERILQCRSILKENVNIHFIEKDDSQLYEVALTDDSNEVATTIAGYIAKSN